MAGRRRLIRGLGALVVCIALAVVVERIVDPPSRTAVTEYDGRTWLSLPGGAPGRTGRLVLANGISGLVEAEARLAATSLPAGLRFAGSDGQATLLEGTGGAVVVADGTHDGTLITAGPRAHSVLGGAGVVTVTDRVAVRPVGADGALGETVVVPGVDPVAGVAPVVDGGGAVWLLAGAAADSVVSIDHDGRVDRRVGVDPGVTGLLIVDGQPYVERSGSVSAVLGGLGVVGGPPGAVVPVVAEATGGRWAVADGATVTLDGGASTVDAGGDVATLALWHGAVWAVVARRVVTVGPGGVTPVSVARGDFGVFADGGRLWFVSATEAVAVDRAQQPTVFRLSALDVDVCVDDCSPDDAVQFAGALPTTTAPPAAAAAPPTIPPPTITLPPHVPTTGATTTTTPPVPPPFSTPPSTGGGPPPTRAAVTTTTTTTPPPTDPVGSTTEAPATTTSTPPVPAPPPPEPPAPPPPARIAAPPTTTAPAATTSVPPASTVSPTTAPSPADVATTDVVSTDVVSTDVVSTEVASTDVATTAVATTAVATTPVATSGVATTTTTTTTTGPDVTTTAAAVTTTVVTPSTDVTTTTVLPVTTTSAPSTTVAVRPIGLVLGFADGGGPTPATSVDVVYGVTGDPAACPGATADSTLVTLSITSSSGTTLTSPQVPFDQQQTITVAVAPGPVTVTLAACGQQATIERLVVGAEPRVGAIAVEPAPVTAGQPFAATVGYTYGAGWSVSGATWTGGPCGAEVVISATVGPTASSVTVPTAQPGRYCVGVVVSFRADDGRGLDGGASAQLDAVPEATTTSTTTSTTSTSTTTTTTTTTSTSTSTTTVPSTTVPSTTVPSTTTTTSTTTAVPTTSSTTSTTTVEGPP